MRSKQRIVFVRHGETEWALKGKHTGKTDIPLTEKGQQQAKAVSSLLENFCFEKAFVSPLQRAKNTFILSGLKVDHDLDPDLYEWDYGDYEGLTKEQICLQDANWSVFTKGAPGGESISQIEARADRMLKKAADCSHDVVFFSSAHILRAIACRFLKQPLPLGKHLILSTGSLSILGFDREDPAILLWNQVP
jgi:probable phosphoglycerate mutase